MLKRLSRRCKGDHHHEHILGGRAKDAALYPLPLIVEILRGMRDEADHKFHVYDSDDATMNMVSAIHATFPPPLPTHTAQYDAERRAEQDKDRRCEVQYLGGSKRVTTYGFKPAYKDEYTQEELDPERARAAIADELA